MGQPSDLRLPPKGAAVIFAIEAGLLPKVRGGWELTAFNRFWESLSSEYLVIARSRVLTSEDGIT